MVKWITYYFTSFFLIWNIFIKNYSNFERRLQINKIYNQIQFDRTIIAIGLKIGCVIGRYWFNHHVEALKLARNNEIVINMDKIRQKKYIMMMSLSIIGEDAYYLNDYYLGIKRLMIRKLFDFREPDMTK